MKIYISGQITGTKDFAERFASAEQKLAGMGFDVCNPAKELAHFPKGTPWRTYMAECLRMLLMCDAVYMMDGWKASKGARLEWQVAMACGLQITGFGQDCGARIEVYVEEKE